MDSDDDFENFLASKAPLSSKSGSKSSTHEKSGEFELDLDFEPKRKSDEFGGFSSAPGVAPTLDDTFGEFIKPNPTASSASLNDLNSFSQSPQDLGVGQDASPATLGTGDATTSDDGLGEFATSSNPVEPPASETFEDELQTQITVEPPASDLDLADAASDDFGDFSHSAVPAKLDDTFGEFIKPNYNAASPNPVEPSEAPSLVSTMFDKASRTFSGVTFDDVSEAQSEVQPSVATNGGSFPACDGGEDNDDDNDDFGDFSPPPEEFAEGPENDDAKLDDTFGEFIKPNYSAASPNPVEPSEAPSIGSTMFDKASRTFDDVSKSEALSEVQPSVATNGGTSFACDEESDDDKNDDFADFSPPPEEFAEGPENDGAKLDDTFGEFIKPNFSAASPNPVEPSEAPSVGSTMFDRASRTLSGVNFDDASKSEAQSEVQPSVATNGGSFPACDGGEDNDDDNDDFGDFSPPPEEFAEGPENDDAKLDDTFGEFIKPNYSAASPNPVEPSEAPSIGSTMFDKASRTFDDVSKSEALSEVQPSVATNGGTSFACDEESDDDKNDDFGDFSPPPEEFAEGPENDDAKLDDTFGEFIKPNYSAASPNPVEPSEAPSVGSTMFDRASRASAVNFDDASSASPVVAKEVNMAIKTGPSSAGSCDVNKVSPNSVEPSAGSTMFTASPASARRGSDFFNGDSFPAVPEADFGSFSAPSMDNTVTSLAAGEEDFGDFSNPPEYNDFNRKVMDQSPVSASVSIGVSSSPVPPSPPVIASVARVHAAVVPTEDEFGDFSMPATVSIPPPTKSESLGGGAADMKPAAFVPVRPHKKDAAGVFASIKGKKKTKVFGEILNLRTGHAAAALSMTPLSVRAANCYVKKTSVQKSSLTDVEYTLQKDFYSELGMASPEVEVSLAPPSPPSVAVASKPAIVQHPKPKKGPIPALGTDQHLAHISSLIAAYGSSTMQDLPLPDHSDIFS